MAQIIAQFFLIIGVDMTPPTNMEELIPYIFTVVIGIFLVSAVFRVIAAIASELFSMRRM
jgi:hypothetical protein